VPASGPALPTSPPVRAGFLYSAAEIGTTSAERLLALSLGGARERIRITNAYFVPNELLRDLLIGAAQRGVDVQLLLPGPRTDVASTRWAGRGFYADLLKAGVQIYEYQPRMLHAKTMTVDGVWSTIGSMNLDNRSVRLNDEGVLLVQDRGVATELDSIFDVDLRSAQRITLAAYRARPLWTRFLEQATRLVAPLL
jgi:cardiolipin synthase